MNHVAALAHRESAPKARAASTRVRRRTTQTRSGRPAGGMREVTRDERREGSIGTVRNLTGTVAG